MSRIEFDGAGDPIPTLALPPFGGDSDIPSTTLTFTENSDFPVSDYVALGFTHFEVWCVGAAGGRGGDATSEIVYAVEQVRRPVSSSVWTLWREYIRIQDYFTSGEWDHIYFTSYGSVTMVQIEEHDNPSHLLPFRMYNQAVLWPTIEGLGGGGGGGGFHKSSGILADLSDVVPIVVGKAGVDAGYGQIHQNGVWTPDMDATDLPVSIPPGTTYPESRRLELRNYFATYLNTYPLPHSSFTNPQPGESGEPSSFAGDICLASGGEGGDPGMVWNGSAFVIDGDGGDGGIGGSLLPGGGGVGSTVEGTNGSDGTWVPETGIGAGGGGGKGGRAPTGGGFPFFEAPTQHLATASGQGSYSFDDTSVYGQRQFRQPWTYMKPVTPVGSGLVTFTPVVDQTRLVTPGGGGGARPFPNMKYGGRATDFSPDGVVVLRLTKIT